MISYNFRGGCALRIASRISVLAIILILSFVGISEASTSVVVTTNPIWTDTGLIINTGDTVSIIASGNWNSGYGPIGPDGGDTTCCDWDFFLANPSALHGELIAFVGSDPYQGQWGNGTFFPQTTGKGYWGIGSSSSFISDRNGKLWLGINDDAVSKTIGDNSGSLTALINTVTTPSIPAAPTGLAVNAVDGNNIHMSWNDNSNNEVGFEISNGDTSVKVGNTNSYTWSGLTPGQYMCFMVRAYNSAGSSAWTPYACTTTTPTPVPTSLTVDKVWTMDGNNADKTNFNPGDVIHYSAIVKNGGSSTLTATFDFLANGPKQIFSWTGQAPVAPGSPSFYSPSTIPVDAPAGIYTLTVTVTYNGTNFSNQSQFTVQPKSTTSGEISGTVYDDFNGNGKKDIQNTNVILPPLSTSGEPGLAGWNISIMRTDMLPFTTTRVTSDKYGNYIFNNVPAGSYTIQEELKNLYWKQTEPNTPPWYTVKIPDDGLKISGKNIGNNLIDKGQYPNAFYAGIKWNSGDPDVPQQAYALDASLVPSYADTSPITCPVVCYNGLFGMYDVYVAYHKIGTPKNYIDYPKGNGNHTIVFGHSGGTQTLLKKLQFGDVTADYAVFIAPALISQNDITNILKSGSVKKKVIIVESTGDMLYQLQAEFNRAQSIPIGRSHYTAPAVTFLHMPSDLATIYKYYLSITINNPIDISDFLNSNGILASSLPKDEIFWAGGSDRTKPTLFKNSFKNSANVIVVDKEDYGTMGSIDVHHQLLVDTIKMFQDGVYPFDGSISGLKKVG